MAELSNYIGKRFGLLTVQHYIKENKKLLCLCDCGKEITKYSYQLKNGQSVCCGCIPRKKPIEQKRYGILSIIEEIDGIKYKRIVKCLCDCGNETIVELHNLKNGHTKSCGCLKLIGYTFTHRMTGSKEYKSYCKMIERCYDTKDINYKNYGGRGIKVCDKWLECFENFFSDMGFKPNPKDSLDRINVNGDYAPSNCRWATKKEQDRNKRNNRWIEYNNKKYILTDIARILLVDQGNLGNMIKKKGAIDAIEYYIKKHKIHELGQN